MGPLTQFGQAHCHHSAGSFCLQCHGERQFINGKDATEADIIQAAQSAAAHQFIMELPNGYDTHSE